MCQDSQWRTISSAGIVFFATKQELMCIKEILWSHFHLHSVYSIKSADIKLLLGLCLDIFLIQYLVNISLATHYVSRGEFIGKSQSCQNFHTCLEVLLNPLIGDQGKSTPIYVNVCFGNKVVLCQVFFPVAYVMGDSLSSDKMCGQFLVLSNVNKVSRVCHVFYLDSDNFECNCQRLSMHWLQQKSIKALKYFRLHELCTKNNVPIQIYLKSCKEV